MANAPAPKRNMTFIWVIWMISVVWLFTTMQNRQPDTRSTVDVYKQIQKDNAETKDVSANSDYHTYKSLLDRDVKEKKLTEPEAQVKRYEAAVLVANTQLRAGIMRNETARVRLAYQTLWEYQKHGVDTPDWKDKQFTAAPDSRFPDIPQSASGQQLFDKVSDILSARNKKEIIWGFIPGGYNFIDTLVGLTGRIPGFSYWFGAFLLALVVRIIVFPFSQKTIMHSRQMSQLSPLITKIREEYKEDPQQMNMKVMELYKEYGLNPAAGCAPAFVQMPLFLSVYQCMLLYQFEFQKGTFLWINKDVSKLTHGFTAPNLGTQDTILIILYGISMICSQMLTPVNDPSQKKQMRLMGIGISVAFTVFMFTGAFPVVSGFVLYWTFTNIFATVQSLRAYRLPLAPLQKVNTKDGGLYPQDPSQLFPWLKNVEAKSNPAANGKPNIQTSTKTGKPKQHKPKK
ncbi:MAG: membrane protein insertase YidC [Armatimonadetes bacterium]|nr:membrane protein insertase YidC [Armatimonadota bacterium]MBS1700149.1 membrane protein insertase YidC [Armatimonadota bacterium]